MTTVTANLRDVGGLAHARQVKFASPLLRASMAEDVITREPVFARPNAIGAISVEVEPGLCDVTIGQDTIRVDIPVVGPADLWELIEATGVLPSTVPMGSIMEAVEEWLDSNGGALEGPPGPPGPPGQGLRIDGQVATYSGLPGSAPDGEMWLAGGRLYLRSSGAWPAEGDGAELGASVWSAITGKPATFPPDSHTHPAADITDSTTVGRAVLTAASAAAARSAIGAGTSSLALGATGSTAAAGNHTHTPADVGAAAAAHSHAIADIVATGTPTSSTFLRGDGTWGAPPTGLASVSSTDITDSTTVGRAVLTAASAAAARSAIGAAASPCDFVWVAQSGTRTTGNGDLAAGMYVGRAFTITKVIYQFDTPDASGSSTVAVRRNGTIISASQIAASSSVQADGSGTDSARTATFTQAFAVGDRFALACTAVGGTPGKGLRAYVFGVWD